jgi:polysaccharide pyruvyl transferase WcaK-like protein
MKTAYLKGYYGYKNFGDEVLLFGIVDRIFSQYPQIEKLYVEVQDATRIQSWIEKNHQ